MTTPHKHADNSASTKVPHKHAELIKQWADGATIQYKRKTNGEWVDVLSNDPAWAIELTYRVKPEPKPDVVVYQTLKLMPDHQRVVSYIETKERFYTDNVMFVFDGETGELKDVQLLTKG